MKADEDYGKRDETPDGSPTDQCVYVETILRPWTKRGDWARDRSAEARWKEVKAYGLDDIEAWLETAPVTWAWISEQFGLNPYGMRSAEAWWDAWATQTNPAMTPDLVLAGRDAATDALRTRLAGAAQITTIGGASLEEMRAVVAAIGLRVDGGGDGQLLARTAFVDDLTTWRSLIESKTPLVLVPVVEALASEVPSVCSHHVVVPVGGAATVDIELPSIDAGKAAAAVQAAGVADDKRADAGGRLARRSLTAFRRHFAIKPALHVPTWANGTVSRSVRASLLACSWSNAKDGDREVLVELAGQDYEQFREALTDLADVEDPLVLRLASSWHLVSPYDAWLVLRAQVTEDDLSRLEVAVQRVLGEEDPTLDLAQEDRWKASLEGKVRAYSGDLRRGLTKTLALLGTHGDSIPGPSGSTGATWAAHLVRSLLKSANDDPTGRTWASLATELPLLAEAAPQEVIDAIRTGVSGPDPILARMFSDVQPAGVFGSNSPHPHLLWALEVLAWSPDHFGAAVDLLARLDAVDPGGNLTNRPFSSLAAIFCPWHPENAATTESRLSVIDGLISRHGKTAWRLLMSMLPEFQGVHSPTAEPDFRDWKPQEKPVTNVEYFTFIGELVTRAIAEAGTDPTRWNQLLSCMTQLPPDDRLRVVNALQSLVESDAITQDAASDLWNSLRRMVRQHREFADADWALPEEELQVLDAVSASLEPQDPYQLHLWLFMDHMPNLGDPNRREDHNAYEIAVADARRDAVEAIDAAGGLALVKALAAEAKAKGVVGWALAQAVEDRYVGELLPLLTGESGDDRDFALSYFAQRVNAGGWTWLDRLFTELSGLSTEQQARLLLLTRDFPKAWEEADAKGPEVAEWFWKNMLPYGLGQDFASVDYVAGRMMGVGRNAAALDFIGMYMHRDGSDAVELAVLVARGLDGLLAKLDDPGLPPLSEYDFESLFEILERHREALGHETVGRLEWAFLPVLGLDPTVPTLHTMMATSPAFFVEVLSTVYRRHGGEREALSQAEEQDRVARAHNGYRLLSSWANPPGLTDGPLDAEALKAWVTEATTLLTDADRLDVGLSHLGHAFVSAPPDEDGSWPPEAVRDLIEDLQSESLEGGFSVEIANSRGVTSRGLEDGGAQERALAEKYSQDAEAFKDRWPRTAAILRRIADGYSSDARRNEDDAERFRRGLEC